MSYVSLQKQVKENNLSNFKLVLTAAMRANELAQGAQPLVNCQTKKVSTIALHEIAAGKVKYNETGKGKGKKS